MASSESENMKGSRPISSSRVMLSGAELVCSVLITRWPVSEASTAMRAVSSSRISPIMMTSGSARRKVRMAAAKVQPMRALTCTWRSPSWVISTGSSAVQILRPSVLSSRITECRVVVLPQPVGPLMRISP
jgi:hypothetical protein